MKKNQVAIAAEVKAQKAIDSFANFISKVGANTGGNNQLSQSTYVFNLLSRNRVQLEAMYRGSWVAGKIIETVADDMTRAGITITSNEEAEQITEIQTAFSRLRIWHSFRDLTKWARLYGGGIAVLLIDGQDLRSPLDIDRVQLGQFKGLKVFDRWQITPDLTNLIKTGTDMGLPAFYTLVTTSTDMPITNPEDVSEMKNQYGYSDGMQIHHSRIIRQTGIELPYFQQITEMMWGESELERLYDRLVAFDNATMSAANLINHANLTNVKIKGLREIIAAGGKSREALEGMFELMRFMRSSEGLTLLDSEDEVESTAYTFAGLADMLLQLAQQLSGATDIPLVKLLGQAPAGLNATGEGDIRLYYDGINTKQESKFRPGVEKVLKVIHKSLFGRPLPKDMQFTFTALWQMSDKEKSEVGKANAETITGTFAGGLISRAMALKELKLQSPQTGLFTTITEQDIADAEAAELSGEAPPAFGGQQAEKDEPEEKDENPKGKPKAKDSLLNKLLHKIRGK